MLLLLSDFAALFLMLVPLLIVFVLFCRLLIAITRYLNRK